MTVECRALQELSVVLRENDNGKPSNRLVREDVEQITSLVLYNSTSLSKLFPPSSWGHQQALYVSWRGEIVLWLACATSIAHGSKVTFKVFWHRHEVRTCFSVFRHSTRKSCLTTHQETSESQPSISTVQFYDHYSIHISFGSHITGGRYLVIISTFLPGF